MRHNAAVRQNNVPSELSFATKSALFGPKNVCPFQILDLTLHIKGGFALNCSQKADTCIFIKMVNNIKICIQNVQ